METTDTPIEPYFLDDFPLEPDFQRAIASDVGLPFHVDVERPDEVPADDQERAIDLAERILCAAGFRTGFHHHEDIRTSMEEWAPDRDEDREDDPGFWRYQVFSMTPRERNIGQLAGEPEVVYQKAQTVLAWAGDCVHAEVLEDIEQSQLEDIEQAWREAAEDELVRREIQQFAEDPPAEVDGWERFDASHDAVEVAYVAQNHDTPSVAAVFETADGDREAREFTLQEWIDSGGNPRDAQPNRFCVSSDADSAHARLRSHLLTFEAEAIADQEMEAHGL
ncbi:hypothetical protein ACFQL1_24015 [Halomicroarcula sp. GCM10025709]|uniref:hypothetical protein n=1 Tax=Haloarcula TaxID=2237 RepID=UPI0024C43378|nr:hypothetical protein [Halomicroarcula sp. YJ-61-S]